MIPEVCEAIYNILDEFVHVSTFLKLTPLDMKVKKYVYLILIPI
jgi:hypothetical protein